MANKGSSEANQQKESGARRIATKTHAHHSLVPTNESTKESGPRRMYAAPGSASSTSTKESGSRRMYASASRSSGNPSAKP